MANDLYSVLGVSKTADTEEIKRAYRKLAAQLHPDRNPGKPDAETKFKAVNQAYTVLSDPAKRALYDEFGEDGLREGFNAENARAYKRYTQGGRVNPGDVFGGMGDAGEGGMGDLFAEIFGRRGGAPGRRVSRRGADWESEITINFAASIKGTTLDLRPRGAGGEPITVRIPPGASDGDRLRVGGQGAAGENGGPPGDLLLVIHVEPHAHFKRDGDDLIIDLPVTPLEAYEGAKVRVPTPEGHISLKLPARSQSGQKIRVKGRGVARRNAEPGDLYVTVQIQLPTGPEAENLLKQLESQMPPDLRKGIEF